MDEARAYVKDAEIVAIGVSERPRNTDGSYMPCFLTGLAVAESISAATGAKLYRFSHQCGHVMAALYSAGRTDLADGDCGNILGLFRAASCQIDFLMLSLQLNGSCIHTLQAVKGVEHMVAQRLATPEGVKTYGERGESFLFDKTYGDADIGEEGYESIEEILASREAALGTCPVCGSALSAVGKMLHGRGHRYRTLCHCERDGDLFLTLKVFPNHNGTFRLRRMLSVADTAECEVYRKKLEDAAAKRHRRPRRRRKGGTKSEGAATAAGSGES